MPDPIARKRLKKKMLDRWENEGGSITTDTTSADASGPTTEDRGRGKTFSKSGSSSAGKPATPPKTRKPTRK